MNQGHEFSFDVGERIESTDENGKIIERASTLVINESGKKETSKPVSVLGEREILTKSKPGSNLDLPIHKSPKNMDEHDEERK